MLTCKDAYDTVVSDPKITFKHGYLIVETICKRFNITPKLFWLVFKNFSGDGPFTNRGRPWMIGILFYIAVHDKQNWLKADVLEKMRRDHSFTFGSCSYEEAVDLLKMPSDLHNLRTLDWCHGVSNTLKNIQTAKGAKFSKCEDIVIYFRDMKTILDAFDDQTNTGKRWSIAKKNFVNFKRD